MFRHHMTLNAQERGELSHSARPIAQYGDNSKPLGVGQHSEALCGSIKGLYRHIVIYRYVGMCGQVLLCYWNRWLQNFIGSNLKSCTGAIQNLGRTDQSPD